MTIDEFPQELVHKRNVTESSFIFCLWKSPDIYGDYERELKADEDFITEEGKFYYSLGLSMYKLGYKSFDDITIYSYLEGKDIVRNKYERYGSTRTVDEMRRVLDINNIESYYDDLMKSNAILRLHKTGYNCIPEMTKFENMTYMQLEDYMEYKVNNIFLKSSINGMTITDLSDGYDKWIEEWDSGSGVGFPVGYPMLNYHLAGIHKKNLILHLASVGQGKTTSAILMYVIPTLEKGEQVCIIANEQGEEDFRQMILATVLFNKIKYRKMNRQKFLFGNFTDEDKKALKEASDWLGKYKGKLHYAHLNDYDTGNIKRIIKKYSKLGVGIFLLDTLKPLDDSSDKAWGNFSEVSKDIFMLAQKEDIAIIATAQLSGASASRRYLDLSCIGKSKAIAETAGQVIMFRPLKQSEKEKLEVYTYMKNVDGKYTKAKKIIQLDVDKDYIVLFVPKNRYGQAGDLQIVYERNMSFNTMKELGYCHIEYDGFGK